MQLGSFLLGSMVLMIQQYADKYQQDDLEKTLTELERDLSLPRISTYDFIIVGGGTAGCLLAGRLSEKFSVLLLESGGSPVPAAANPFLMGSVAAHPAVNNIFTSIPQLHFTQESGGIVKTITGRMLGGSGSHNGNVYNRGSPSDYNNFAQLTGDDSWTYDNVLKHFKNIENFVGGLVNEYERPRFYGTGGHLTVSTDISPILSSWFQSGKELGYKAGDPNGYQVESFTPVAMSLKNGERESAYTAFVKPFEKTRSKLTVLRYSEVEQVLINSDKVAYGVVYKRHGIPQIAHASNEVIVSGGAISSPMTLIKSGIGPKNVLDQAKIPIKSNVKGVGKNFRDHGAVILSFTVNNPNTTLFQRLDEETLQEELRKFQEIKRQGFPTKMAIGPQAFIVSSRAKSDLESHWPDIQISLVKQPALDKDLPQTISLFIVAGRMKSSGEIGFNSTAYLNGDRDDLKLALTDYRLFTEPSDAQVLIEGIQLGIRILEETTPFKKMGVVYSEAPPEACRSLVFRSHAYWECYVKQRGYNWLHMVGTCAMGKATDPMAVVDSKLRVRGIKRLRVVDASVMPRTPNSNTNAPVMLVAEKAFQHILADHIRVTKGSCGKRL